MTIVALGLGWSLTHPARPILELAGASAIDRGTIAGGTYARQSWEIRNVGNRTLHLRTRFTAGRSGFSLWQGSDHCLEAGAKITVHLTWPVPKPASGPFETQALLWTDDPTQPELRLRVVGKSGPASLRAPDLP